MLQARQDIERNKAVRVPPPLIKELQTGLVCTPRDWSFFFI